MATLPQAVLDRFLLRTIEEKVAKRSTDAQDTIGRLVRAAESRLAVAESQTDERVIASVLALQRDAAMFLAAAILEDGGEHVELTREQVFAKLSDWRTKQSDAPAVLADLDAFLSSSDPIASDRLSADDALALRDRLKEACAYLRAHVEPRSVKEVQTARRARIVIGALVLAAIVGWAIRAITHPTNYARSASVTMSSQYPGTPSPENLVNGEIEPKYGGHTAVQENPWILVDLGQERSIKEIRVYNRGDEFAAESTPLDIEVSADGIRYEAFDHRDPPFSQADPWVVAKRTTTRFVRLSKSHGYIALAEIEIY